MFQSFVATTRPEQGPPRLRALRAEMAREGLDGFLVPRADAHQGETVAPRDERLAWLTGFTGSAGFAAVLRDVAGVFVDGRYRLQVRGQVAQDFTPVDWPATKLGPWLISHLPEGGRVGFDPWLHTEAQIAALREELEVKGIAMMPCENLIDRIWEDQPPPPEGRIVPHSLELAGEASEDKRARLAAGLREAGHEAAVLTLPDSIAWLLNLRGSDVARTPVPHAFAILYEDARVDLFVAPQKVEELALDAGVTALPPDGLAAALTFLGGPVRVDRDTAPVAVADILREAEVEIAWEQDPCILPKARKNSAEIAGTAEAHLRDGAAMVRFLAWLDAEAPGGGLTEIEVARRLEQFRRETNALEDISFETIAGSGPDGAIVHYRVTKESDRALQDGNLLLVDSGGQYRDGTTDVTRTIAVGEPTEEQVACFTRVLRGMIGISTLRWPTGLAGRDLDPVARAPLWRAGQDFDHGTGHGVGVYLSVHEGPQRLSRTSEVPLEPGMILSNEPGYYREGAFGIRIENLVVVEDAPKLEGGDDRRMLRFRTLTFVPIDRRLIDAAMLAPDEREWLNRYHAEVAERIGPRVDGAAAAWLARATAPI
ncbi:aminopeptidase P family protein [Roseitranquillus sediminis]|uniref:aminopeptidase P family protein n=1 Tax=Roseitranquillus sediminis TaxID=2809051 RepID=UPI001D0CBC2F|nr:aminopeptidase P family protein [Roseitranquillus sediminis]MBM9594618.1 aminopeptidase P family protein [Roseitranquillus sediminis]